MTELSYTVRPNLLVKERTYRLSDDALTWQDADGSGRLAFAGVRQVRLSTDPSFGKDRSRCILLDREGHKLKLDSKHFKGLGTLEDRSSTYTPFVRALLQRVAAAAPHASFVAGSTAVWAVWVGLTVVYAIAILALMMAVLGGASLGGEVIVVLIPLIVLGPGMWRAMRRGRATTFDPAHPPPELLGETRAP